ncbi:MAG: CBS and ACT domain-containing protein [Desulfomonile sp.]|nr:CBS and ACT domain-containing protein [Desulfomonile sp.]
MLVKYWMQEDVVTVDVDDSMSEATTLMKQHNPVLLPVMKNGRLAGVITDRDIKRASASDATTLSIHELSYLLTKIKCGEIMSKPAITIPADFTIEEAANTLLANQVSGAPVVNRTGEIVGIISQRELFVALISLSGLPKRGVQFAFEVEDRPGSIKEVTDIIREYGARLVSILTSYDRAPAGYRHVFVRAYAIDRSRLDQLKQLLREKATLLYAVDHLENKREEYIELNRAT